MNRPANHPSTDLTVKLQWKRGNPWFKGHILHYDYVAARLWASELKIEELEQTVALLKKGCEESVLEIASQRGTITALKEQCREFARNSD